MTRVLGPLVAAFHQRPLSDDYLYLMLDGIWLRCKGAQEGHKIAVLVAYGITAEGRRKLLMYGIVPPEHSSSMRDLLRGDRRVGCPRCQSTDTECVSEFGSTPCKALHRCRACLEPFEYFKCI